MLVDRERCFSVRGSLGFRYDYDDVETVVSPPMPADLVLTTDPQTKKSLLTANPLPIQVRLPPSQLPSQLARTHSQLRGQLRGHPCVQRRCLPGSTLPRAPCLTSWLFG